MNRKQLSDKLRMENKDNNKPVYTEWEHVKVNGRSYIRQSMSKMHVCTDITHEDAERIVHEHNSYLSLRKACENFLGKIS